MRITNSMLSNTILKNISASYERLEKYEAQLSSGKLFRRPSDNPITVKQAMDIRASLKDIDQYLGNIEDGISWLDTADTALRNASDLLHRAKELAVRGANATNSQDELQAIALEVDQLLENMISIGNTTFADRYVFAGHKTTMVPFTNAGSTVNYNGDSGSISYEIEKGITAQVNLPGDNVFKGTTDVFQVLIDLRDHLRAGNYSAVSQDTSRVDDALDAITNALTVIGARTNHLELTRDRQEQAKINLSEILSNIEDADLAEVIVKLKMEENVYQSALLTGSMAMQKSLIDFLK
ncbi:MAG: flagellar hook-associated protein FlgL [Actinomycetota bacterium]|nr:flagellar hook-associated protein FlgL [Actinomycetota bacterium]